eukprot:6294280-Amphidinium_carterae.1
MVLRGFTWEWTVDWWDAQVGFFGPSCGDRECPHDCHGHGDCHKDACCAKHCLMMSLDQLRFSFEQLAQILSFVVCLRHMPIPVCVRGCAPRVGSVYS